MNNKAFTLVELLAVIVILAIVLAIAIPSITSLIEGSKASAYLANEKMLSKAANTYLSANEGSYPTDPALSKVIQLDNLVNDKYITNIKDISNSSIECEGYVVVKTNGNNTEYNPYIKCGSNYETEGFNTNLLSTSEALNAEVLVVAGGGGGEGGGGGGGVIYNTNYPVAIESANVVTVGSGGLASAISAPGGNGGNSVFDTMVAIGGGGGGGGNPPTSGNSGGSGGGAACAYGQATGSGAGTSGQGYSGGTGLTPDGNNYAAGGGGGAGGQGGNANSVKAGDGGIGFSSSISGVPTYYGGGGGGQAYNRTGGTGGLGGGGNGVTKNTTGKGTPGTPNTGGGAGGSGYATSGTTGGSGIVIVAYPGTVVKATGGTISTTSRPGYVVHTFTTSGTFALN